MTGPERLAAFVAAWTALSRLLLRAPDAEDLAAVRDPDLLAVWPLGRDAATAEGLALLGSSTEDAQAVRDDYNRLFVIGRLLAPPWESVHRGNDRLIFDEQTMQVRAWYGRYGLTAPRLNRDPDDHVGLELEFCAQLGQLALDQPADAGRVTADLGVFLTEHLGTWGPGFADQVAGQAQTACYRGVGRLLAGTLAQSVAEFAPEPVGELP